MFEIYFVMYEKYESPNSAYQKLQKIGILERARKVEEDLTDIFLFRTIWDGKAEQIVEESRKAEPNEESQDILSLESELEAELNVLQMDPHVIKHPFLVAKVVLGDDLENFSQYGFSSKKDLASAVTAYCIGEMEIIKNDTRVYIWRQGIHKNKINLIDHGDLSVSQTNVSNENESGILVNPPTSGYGIQQDWSPLLITTLRYAQAIGKSDLPEIKKWQELIKELRTHNSWGNGYSDYTGKESHLNFQFGCELAGTGDKNLKLQIGSTVPYYNKKESTLNILKESESGEVVVKYFGGEKKFEIICCYIPDDLPHLLKANYQLYARNVDDMAKIMYHFNEEFNI
jgi:hypothetical protein